MTGEENILPRSEKGGRHTLEKRMMRSREGLTSRIEKSKEKSKRKREGKKQDAFSA